MEVVQLKKLYSILAAIMLVALGVTGCGSSENFVDKSEIQNNSTDDTSSEEKITDNDNTESLDNDDNSENEGDLLSGTYNVKMTVKDYGDIELELYADKAPITVTNFIGLVKEGFYDGLTFHRIISGFMAQGGDPEGTGLGGSDTTIKGEFSANGVENDISHERGVISMARSSDFDSASSQFFIMHADNAGLDGQYAAFGRVTKGMEVVDKICEDAKPVDGNGTISADEQPVIESITVIE